MPVGTHLLINASGCDSPILTDEGALAGILERACREAGARVRAVHEHKFEGPGGVTILACLAESSAVLHTYPELGQWFADVFTCAGIDPMPAGHVLANELGGTVRMEQFPRGV